MDILLTHLTALEALRSYQLRWRLTRGQPCDACPPGRPPTREELANAMARLPESVRGLDRPEVLLANDAPRSRPRHVRTHRAPAALPARCAIELAPGVRCVSPEHLAVQLAPLLTELELICLLSELLGTYAIAPGLDRGMFERESPLTTPELVRAHLERLGPAPGTARVRRALRWACVRSASPRETKLSLRLGLPKARGGYGLEVLSMNDPMEVRRIHDAMRTGVRKPDILLRAPVRPGHGREGRRGVAFEYEGRDHETPERHAQDIERRNELAAMDITEFTISRTQYADLDYMDGIVDAARREMGIREARVTRAVAARRRQRRRELWLALEDIDGVSWGFLSRGGNVGAPAEPDDSWDVVPVDAYHLD